MLTVGGSSTQGTRRAPTTSSASFSSRGPTYIDWNAKPDLVAPGTGTVSLSSPGSTFYRDASRIALLAGTLGDRDCRI